MGNLLRKIILNRRVGVLSIICIMFILSSCGCGDLTFARLTVKGFGSGTIISIDDRDNGIISFDCTISNGIGTEGCDVEKSTSFEAKLEPTPAAGSTFFGWINCPNVQSDNSCFYQFGTGDRTITALFEAAFTLDVISAACNVTGTTPSTIACATNAGVCSEIVLDGTTVALSAVPVSGVFTSWAGCDAVAGADCDVTLVSDRSVTATCTTLPEIDVQRPAGTSIADGGSDDLNEINAASTSLTYTIDNTAGVSALTVSSVTAANLTNVSGFNVTTGLPLSVPAGSTATITVEFNMDAVGVFEFDLDIVSDDADENPYDIFVFGNRT